MPVKQTLPKTEEKKSEWQDYRCYATFHPSSVLLGGFQFEEKIVEDFKRFSNKQLQPPREGLPKIGASVIGFDTEYDPGGTLLTVGAASLGCAAAAEVSDTKGFAQAKKVIRGAKRIVGHSVTGDLDYLVRLGIAKEAWLRGDGIRDSLLLARMVDENRGKGGYGLESLLLSEFNFGAWKRETEILLKKTGNAADWPVEARTARCRLDAWATLVLAAHFEKRLRDER